MNIEININKMNFNAWIFILQCVICNITALDSRGVNNMRVSGGSLHLITISGDWIRQGRGLTPLDRNPWPADCYPAFWCADTADIAWDGNTWSHLAPDPSVIMRIEGGWGHNYKWSWGRAESATLLYIVTAWADWGHWHMDNKTNTIWVYRSPLQRC